MTTPTPTQQRALGTVLTLVDRIIRDMGDEGCPEGVLYAALMPHGCTHSQFASLVGALEHAGRIRRAGHVLYAVNPA